MSGVMFAHNTFIKLNCMTTWTNKGYAIFRTFTHIKVFWESFIFNYTIILHIRINIIVKYEVE